MTFDSVGGRAALAHNKKAVEAAGGTLGRSDLSRSTTTDFTPFAQAVNEKKPDIVVGHYGSGQNLGVIPALRRSGYNGPYVVASYGVTEDTIRQAAQRAGSGENIYYVTPLLHRRSTRTRRWPKSPPRRRSTARRSRSRACTSPAGRSAKFAEAALKGCGWPCTREKLDKAIQTLKVDMGGLTGGPIEMSATDHYGPSYWRLYAWEPRPTRWSRRALGSRKTPRAIK